MNKINFPKTIKINICGEEIKITPYLTYEQINTIVKQVIQEQDYIVRDAIKDTLIVRFCTDIKEFDTDELDINILDKYRICGIINEIKKNIINIEYVDKYISEYESVSNQVRIFIEQLNVAMTSFNQEDLTNTLKSSIIDLQKVSSKE